MTNSFTVQTQTLGLLIFTRKFPKRAVSATASATSTAQVVLIPEIQLIKTQGKVPKK